MPLPEIIIDTIRRQGPLSFKDFMEMALYYPGQGYYASSGERVGEGGDFYTSPYLTRLFGDMIAGQLEEMWGFLRFLDHKDFNHENFSHENFDHENFTVVEYGAGSGLLCRDILGRLRDNPVLFERLHYVIIEKSPRMQNKERELLAAEGLLDKVCWESSIHALGPVTGCVLSNELVDNFAVHQVVMADELMEVFVAYDNGFVEVLRPAAQPLKDYLAELHVTLPRGFRTEINLEATEWIQEVSSALRHGFVITIDYGNSSSGLYSQGAGAGTLVCYHEHRVNHSPYEWIGEQDITSHVNFSALEHWGRRGGLEYCGYTSQSRFLQGLGLTRRLQQLEQASRQGRLSQENFRQLYTLLVDMGSKFKVLIQRKGVSRKFLSGLQFSQHLA